MKALCYSYTIRQQAYSPTEIQKILGLTNHLPIKRLNKSFKIFKQSFLHEKSNLN